MKSINVLINDLDLRNGALDMQKRRAIEAREFLQNTLAARIEKSNSPSEIKSKSLAALDEAIDSIDSMAWWAMRGGPGLKILLQSFAPIMHEAAKKYGLIN